MLQYVRLWMRLHMYCAHYRVAACMATHWVCLQVKLCSLWVTVSWFSQVERLHRGRASAGRTWLPLFVLCSMRSSAYYMHHLLLKPMHVLANTPHARIPDYKNIREVGWRRRSHCPFQQ